MCWFVEQEISFQCDNTFFDINQYGWIFNDTFIFKEALYQHGGLIIHF